MKLLLGDDVDRTPIGTRSRLQQAVRTSNGASRRVPVLLQASPVTAEATVGSVPEVSPYRSWGKFSETAL